MKKKSNDNLQSVGNSKVGREDSMKAEIEKFMDDEMQEMCGGTISESEKEEEKTCKCIVFASA